MLALTGAPHLKLITRRKAMDSVSRALLVAGGISADLDPNAFGFNNAGGASLSTLTTSNTITPIGYDTPTTWSVTNGGQGSVNGGAYASSGTISPGQNFTVRGTSSSSYSTSVSFLISIGLTESTWFITTMAMPTEASYTSAGTYTFIVPAGVTSASVVAIGGGGGGGGGTAGGGGGLNWRNNISVTAGTSMTIVVGNGGYGGQDSGSSGGNSSAAYPLECVAGGGTTSGGGRNAPSGGGGSGGSVQAGGWYGAGGGGAGGYSGNGGSGASVNQYGYDAAFGSGGGGGGAAGGEAGSQSPYSTYYWWGGGGGGGVGINGRGSSGLGPARVGTSGGAGGGGGSGGSSGGSGGYGGGAGGLYGGGGAGGAYYENYDGDVNATSFSVMSGGGGANGAVRIIWPGTTRQFPTTNV